MFKEIDDTNSKFCQLRTNLDIRFKRRLSLAVNLTSYITKFCDSQMRVEYKRNWE